MPRQKQEQPASVKAVLDAAKDYAKEPTAEARETLLKAMDARLNEVLAKYKKAA